MATSRLSFLSADKGNYFLRKKKIFVKKTISTPLFVMIAHILQSYPSQVLMNKSLCLSIRDMII